MAMPTPTKVSGQWQCPTGYKVGYDNWDTLRQYPFCVYDPTQPPPTLAAPTPEPTPRAEQFSGKLITVQPNKAVYDVGETAILRIVADTRYSASWDWTGEWRTFYDVWNDEGKIIAQKSCSHSISPLTKEDYAHDDFKLSIGSQKRSQKLKVRLVAMPFVLSSKYFFLDDKLIDILVVGKEMPDYITPTPTPTPTPIPTKVTTEAEKKAEAEEAEANIWLWVIIGIAVVVLIAFGVKRGRK